MLTIKNLVNDTIRFAVGKERLKSRDLESFLFLLANIRERKVDLWTRALGDLNNNFVNIRGRI